MWQVSLQLKLTWNNTPAQRSLLAPKPMIFHQGLASLYVIGTVTEGDEVVVDIGKEEALAW